MSEVYDSLRSPFWLSTSFLLSPPPTTPCKGKSAASNRNCLGAHNLHTLRWVGLVFIQKLVICVFMYNTITVYYSRNKEVTSQLWHCWSFLCRMKSFRLPSSGVCSTFPVWRRKSTIKKSALIFYTIRSVFSSHGYSAKCLLERKLDDGRNFTESHIRV